MVDNQGSDFFTILEIFSQDRLGLLYNISKALFEAELNISFRQDLHQGGPGGGCFLCDDLEGQKIRDEEQIGEIKKAILFALEQ